MTSCSDEHVKYKERIAFSTMRASIPDWQPPKDWNSLTNNAKTRQTVMEMIRDRGLYVFTMQKI